MGAEDVSWTAPAFGAGRPVSNIQGVPTVAACTFKMRPTTTVGKHGEIIVAALAGRVAG
jgi:hypothetical protein